MPSYASAFSSDELVIYFLHRKGTSIDMIINSYRDEVMGLLALYYERSLKNRTSIPHKFKGNQVRLVDLVEGGKSLTQILDENPRMTPQEVDGKTIMRPIINKILEDRFSRMKQVLSPKTESVAHSVAGASV